MPGLLSPGWPLAIIAEAAVPHLEIMDAYVVSIQQRTDRILLYGVDTDQRIEQVGALLELLEVWVVRATSMNLTQNIRQEIA